MSLVDALHLAFMQRALAAGVLVAAMTGLLGVFVVQRRLSFLGAGLAHAAFGGMGLGAFIIVSTGLLGSGLGLLRHPLWIAVPFSLLAALAIAWVRANTRLSSDTAIGVFFAVSVAMGVLFFSIIPPDVNLGLSLMDLLFGSILGVTGPDLAVIAVVTVVALAFLLAAWGHLGYATFDEELARTDGVRARLLEYLLFACAALVIAVSSVVVGIILMAAYLVIPAASARLLARSLAQMSVLSVVLALVSTVAGLALSYLLDVPSGSTIVLTQAGMFLLAAAASTRARPGRER